ncbi:DUF4435 domain-containing protein [Agrobacterium pusense]|uniref:DUF4435 domain-containing protein n=1 Tax=Agrobacterium pusense TaxID=648995 RepID=U4Q6Y7_9HYPH|nr:DUF4435 domain-containing protein [Agrobacterium pusense]CDI08351.1 protein of unknown function [Agrobacterium pusense]
MTDLVAEARAKKESAPVSFARFLEIRAVLPDCAIAAVEGRDDIGVWSVWFVRCGVNDHIEVLPCNGKEKVFELRQILARNRRERTDNIRYFIDRDYDDWGEHQPASDVFMTDRYSIENYFICERVLSHALNTLFQCAAAPGHRQPIIDKFHLAFEAYRVASDEVQKRTYCRIRLKVKKGDTLPKKLKDIVQPAASYDYAPLATIPVAEPECSDPSTLVSLRHEFEQLNFRNRARGKYHRAFFQHFLQSLQKERDPTSRELFPADKPEAHFQYSALNLSELAGVSDMPINLEEFVQKQYC